MESLDRRNLRTQRWLRSAFLELVKEKPYEAITNELHPQQAAGYPISRTDVVVECEAVNILCHVLAV
jgi:hypothetical protein